MSARVPGGNFGVSAMAGLSALGLAACTPGNGSGPTTIIQTVVNGGGSSTTTSTTPSVIPINDSKKLCRLFSTRGREIVKSVDDFFLLIPKSGSGKTWSWDQQDILTAASRATSSIQEGTPVLVGSIGPEIPGNLADALKAFAVVYIKIKEAFDQRADVDELDPLQNSTPEHLDAVNKICWPDK